MNKKILGVIAAGLFAATVAVASTIPAHAGTCNLSPECKASYEAEIAYWKRQAASGGQTVVHRSRKVVNVAVRSQVTTATSSVNTCVVSTTHEPGFMSGFAYKNGSIIWETHKMVNGLSTTWCLPRNVWAVADKFWVCKKQSSRFPNGRGKILLPNDMADWRSAGRPLGVMDVQD